VVAQINKKNAAVIADAMTPARKAYEFADIALAQVAAFVCAISMHVRVFMLAGGRVRILM
jgi:hypothetical protein